MNKESKTWLAAKAIAGLTFSLLHAGDLFAQPPGRGPGGPAGPGGDGRQHVAEMFSRMDQNNDGKLSKDEVPEPMWDRLSNLDANGDGSVTKDEASKAMSGGRPDGGRPDGAPNDRGQEDQPRGRGPHPPIEHSRGDAPRGEERGPRDAHVEHGRPASPGAPSQPDCERSGQPDRAHRGPMSFNPEAFFDRLDKDRDGSLSRDEFQVIAEFHRHLPTPPGPQGFRGHRGPGAPDLAHRGLAPGSGGPPWGGGDRGPSFGPHQFPGGPPWLHSGHGPQLHGKFAGPPWAQHAQPDRNSHPGKKNKGHNKHKGSDPNKKKQHDRPDSQDRDRHHSDAKSSRAGADLATAETPRLATLPL